MSISTKDAHHVAKLARLALGEQELQKYTDQLNAVLEYAAQLQALDTAAIEPTFNPFNNKAVLREDSVADFENKAALVANGPKVSGTSFVVPRIL